MKRGSPAAHRESKAQRGRLYNGSEQGQPRTLGAPRPHAQLGQYQTKGGILVHCVEAGVGTLSAIEELVDRLDEHRGCLFQSSYDFPGRYARWTMGFSDPPLVMEACGRSFTVSALNSRGRVLLPAISKALHKSEARSRSRRPTRTDSSAPSSRPSRASPRKSALGSTRSSRLCVRPGALLL